VLRYKPHHHFTEVTPQRESRPQLLLEAATASMVSAMSRTHLAFGMVMAA